ncbi:TPA: hypothetical protein MDU75_004979 [Klebsiella pneumoniae]|nr:hypothetical protein [Klebsiella pneumoniae]
MQKAKLHKMVGRVATTGVEAPLTEPVLVMKSFPLATWRGSKIKVMEKLHDRPDKVAKKAIQKGDWRFILSAMAAERRLLRLRMVSPAGIMFILNTMIFNCFNCFDFFVPRNMPPTTINR